MNSITISDSEYCKRYVLGMLTYYLEEARKLAYKENEILYSTYKRGIKINKLRRGFRNNKKSALVKFAGKKIFSISRDIDNLVFDVFNITKYFINKDDLVKDINELIHSYLSGRKEPMEVTMVRYPLIDIAPKFIEVAKPEVKKVPRREPVLKEVVEDRESRVLTLPTVRDEDVYYGTLFPISAENIHILKQIKRSYND